MSRNTGRPLAPHVQAAIAGAMQPKVGAESRQPLAPHVQAAIAGAMQPKVGGAEPKVAAHAQAAIALAAQPKLAAQVRAAIAGAAQPKVGPESGPPDAAHVQAAVTPVLGSHPRRLERAFINSASPLTPTGSGWPESADTGHRPQRPDPPAAETNLNLQLKMDPKTQMSLAHRLAQISEILYIDAEGDIDNEDTDYDLKYGSEVVNDGLTNKRHPQIKIFKSPQSYPPKEADTEFLNVVTNRTTVEKATNKFVGLIRNQAQKGN